MTTWILIISIFGSEGSAAVTSVPGFNTDASCQEAGRAWSRSISAGWLEGRRTSYVCVEQKPPVDAQKLKVEK
jgi:hypothetical protein